MRGTVKTATVSSGRLQPDTNEKVIHGGQPGGRNNKGDALGGPMNSKATKLRGETKVHRCEAKGSPQRSDNVARKIPRRRDKEGGNNEGVAKGKGNGTSSSGLGGVSIRGRVGASGAEHITGGEP